MRAKGRNDTSPDHNSIFHRPLSTWIFVEELRLLLDAGDGVSAALLQKSRKVDWVAVTHPDRDHIHGLFQLLQLNARDDKPQIHYPRAILSPKSSLSLPA
jgi:ribonuclease BN (tRNA processing enzyme)